MATDNEYLDSLNGYNYYNEYDGNLRFYFNKIKRYPLLSREEEYELALKVCDGDKAARQLLKIEILHFYFAVCIILSRQ